MLRRLLTALAHVLTSRVFQLLLDKDRRDIEYKK